MQKLILYMKIFDVSHIQYLQRHRNPCQCKTGTGYFYYLKGHKVKQHVIHSTRNH